MGRYLKNTVFKSGSYALGVPTGSTTVTPDSPQPGQTRYNESNSQLEFYNDGQWNTVAKEGSVTVVKDTFTGNAVADTFGPMSYSYNAGQEAQVLVFLNTVFQNPGVNYSFSNAAPDTIQFTSTPANLAAIVILHNLSSTTV